MIGIYKITSPSGKIYIGQSIDIKSRWNDYKKGWCRFQRRLNFSFKKYGVDNHNFEVIEHCDIKQLNERERYWQEYYDVINVKTGLNSLLTKTNDKSGVKSEETKQKIRDTFKTKGVVKGENNPMFGRRHKEISKTKMSLKAKGRKAKPETIKKRIELTTGHNNPRAKLVLNLETGIYYECAKYAAEAINMNKHTFRSRLRGVLFNNTSFIYV